MLLYFVHSDPFMCICLILKIYSSEYVHNRREKQGYQLKKDFPPRDDRGWPLFIYFNIYSPQQMVGSSVNEQFNDLINITMTYRKDSNVENPYGRFIPYSQQAKNTYDKWLPYNSEIPTAFDGFSNKVNDVVVKLRKFHMQFF